MSSASCQVLTQEASVVLTDIGPFLRNGCLQVENGMIPGAKTSSYAGVYQRCTSKHHQTQKPDHSAESQFSHMTLPHCVSIEPEGLRKAYASPSKADEKSAASPTSTRVCVWDENNDNKNVKRGHNTRDAYEIIYISDDSDSDIIECFEIKEELITKGQKAQLNHVKDGQRSGTKQYRVGNPTESESGIQGTGESKECDVEKMICCDMKEDGSFKMQDAETKNSCDDTSVGRLNPHVLGSEVPHGCISKPLEFCMDPEKNEFDEVEGPFPIIDAASLPECTYCVTEAARINCKSTIDCSSSKTDIESEMGCRAGGIESESETKSGADSVDKESETRGSTDEINDASKAGYSQEAINNEGKTCNSIEGIDNESESGNSMTEIQNESESETNIFCLDIKSENCTDGMKDKSETRCSPKRVPINRFKRYNTRKRCINYHSPQPQAVNSPQGEVGVQEECSFEKLASIKCNEDEVSDKTVVYEPVIVEKKEEHKINKDQSQNIATREPDELYCNLCGRHFSLEGLFMSHSCFTATRVVFCTQCDQKLVSISRLWKHYHSHHQGECDLSNIDRSFYINETKSQQVTGEEIQATVKLPQKQQAHAVCSVAGRETVSCGNTIESKKQDANPSLSCSRCGRGYDRISKLRTHSKLHSKPKYHPCVLCMEEFESVIMFYRHWKRNHCNAQTDQRRKLHDRVDKSVKRKTVNYETMGISKVAASSETASGAALRENNDASYLYKDIKFQCDLCEMTFLAKRNMVKHKKTFHLKGKDKIRWYTTRTSKDAASSENASGATQRENNDAGESSTVGVGYSCGYLCKDMKYQCNLCEKTFLAKRNLVKHVKNIHFRKKDKKHWCSKCKQDFFTKQSFTEHQDTCHVTKQSIRKEKPRVKISCETCGKTFICMSSLRKHLHKQEACKNMIMNSTAGIPCDICGQNYSSKYRLMVHMHRSHHAPLECDTCSCRFFSADVLQKHMNQMHTQQITRPFLCSVCGKSFRQKHQLRDHSINHTGDYGYRCPDCNKGFKAQYRLNYHRILMHLQERNAVCQTCGKRFRTVSTLKNHMRLHTGEKPYKCGLCEARFRNKPTLVVHHRLHTGETPYSCKNCYKRFKTLSQVKTHAKIHSDMREHCCVACGESFKLAHHLRAHVARKHKETDDTGV